ncbi:MAG: hypothetical protein DM484_18490 [Candidatus Methylumidiphilus alinenensis]|uniref:Glycosyltransferase subfamily 4-like N-terminal domain-containing protein n=1 Tax=Candidatus Methylumidiphilus alinenensis TaxID=2202197 RepID=A0A2W4QZP9_9GAMM|nr:MAG: hypothetical protein DM484_18490 [Candidatus Methylumidiphilus alinenensis]
MKVEIVSFTGHGGLADYALSLAQALSNCADTRLVTAKSLSVRFDSSSFQVERVFRRTRHYPIDIIPFIVGVLRRKPDWVLVQGYLTIPAFDALTVRLLRKFGVKSAVTVHDVLPHYPRKWSFAEFGFYFRSFDKVIVHSTLASEQLRQMGVIQDILIIPHGVYDIFNLTGISKSKARLKIGGIEADDFVVLFFGHLEPRKGLMEFLAMAKLACKQPHLKFLVAGSNNLARHGRAFVEQLEEARSLPNLLIHDKRIEFECVENYFSACDIVALPYLEGSTSGVLKLALAFGKPVVATKVGDLPEQTPVGGGVLIENGSSLPIDLIDAINRIKSNYCSYADSMVNARKKADWGDISKKVFQFLSCGIT